MWLKYVHIFDGSGGFLDGTYLIAHPREWKDWKVENPSQPTKKLKARRQLARYENIARTILDQKSSALFRGAITRTVGGSSKADKEKDNTKAHPIEEWWDNVDGYYCSITDWMSEAFIFAALFGHVLHYMDLPTERADATTAADVGQPFLRAYTPLDVPDWLQNDRGHLLAVKLLERDPGREDLMNAPIDAPPMERIVTDTAWALYKRGEKDKVEGGSHPFGTLPIVVQYAKRRKLSPLIGESVLGDPNLYIDMYNLTSEIRELLRLQTFGVMDIKLGTGDTATPIEKAQAMLGDEKGPENVLFTPGGAQYVQPDTNNVTVYQDERRELLRTIYRLAAIPWESDSKDAEAEGSMQLKREDMNQVLAAYADECEKAEISIAKLWFRARYGAGSWEAEWDKAQVQIRYPDNFDVTPFAEILEQAEAGVSLELGRSKTFSLEQSKRLLPKFLPDLPQVIVETIEKEWEAEPVMSPAQQKLEEIAMRFPPDGGAPPPGGAQ